MSYGPSNLLFKSSLTCWFWVQWLVRLLGDLNTSYGARCDWELKQHTAVQIEERMRMMGLLISRLGLCPLSRGMPGIWRFVRNRLKKRRSLERSRIYWAADQVDSCQSLSNVGRKKNSAEGVSFRSAGSIGPTSSELQVKTGKAQLAARIHHAREDCAGDKGGVSLVRARQWRWLKRLSPCDHAKGEPLMCHINPPVLFLASARTMMSSATANPALTAPMYCALELDCGRGKFRCVSGPVLMKNTHTYTHVLSLIWTTWQLPPRTWGKTIARFQLWFRPPSHPRPLTNTVHKTLSGSWEPS